MGFFWDCGAHAWHAFCDPVLTFAGAHPGSPHGTFIFSFLSEISVGNLTLWIRPPKLSILIAYHWKAKMLGECEPHWRLLCCCCCRVLTLLQCTPSHPRPTRWACEASEAERTRSGECPQMLFFLFSYVCIYLFVTDSRNLFLRLMLADCLPHSSTCCCKSFSPDMCLLCLLFPWRSRPHASK